MKLVTFTHSKRTRIGVVVDEMVVDLSESAPELPLTMLEFLEAGTAAMEKAKSVSAGTTNKIPLSAVRLEAPVPNPRKLLGIGGNTRSHLEEVKAAGIPLKFSPYQTWFNKQVTCINGPYDDIHMPDVSRELDYEGEMVAAHKYCESGQAQGKIVIDISAD